MTKVKVFGEWDAPITDGAVPTNVPTDMSCINCGQHFQLGDNGAVMPNGFAQHRECALRAIIGGIGHLVDHERYCKGELGTDAGLTYRQSAILVWAKFTNGVPISPEQLEGGGRSILLAAVTR